MSAVNPLRVPQIADDISVMQAALLYAACGWYVGPIKMDEPDTTGKRPNAKNPGSILGKRWQTSTANDIETIVTWFAGTDANGVFLHAGRSGAVIFDVDYPAKVPEVLARVLWKNWNDPVEDRVARVPFQSTRPDEPGRGHYLVLQPTDRILGNGHGNLGNDWGEVRGNNGIIVVEPTQHESNGRYRWEAWGAVPALEPELDAELPSIDSSKEEAGPASDDHVKEFWDRCVQTDNINLMKGPLREFAKEVDGNPRKGIKGASRHDTAVKFACQLMREALMGFYPAQKAANALYDEFEKRLRGTPGRFPSAEYKSIIAWAVGQAETIDIAARRKELEDRLVKRDERLRAEKHTPVASAVAPRADGLDPDPLGLLKPDPDKYFQDKSAGIDVDMLADDVMHMGPLARGRDGHFWEYKNGVWRLAKKVVKNRCVTLLGPRYRQAHAGNAEDVVGARVAEILCEPVPDYFNCRNGMFDWRTGQFEAHSPEFMSTVQFPWDMDIDAECPRFEKYLSETLSPDYIELTWQMIGYLLYSGNPRQKAFMLHGKGGEGKGTLLRVITAMLGNENIASETLSSLTMSKFSAINLYGKIANIAGDIEGTFQTETNTFKALTGQDLIGAEHKYGDRINFVNWAVPVFSANKIPGSADVTEGYLRRWLVIRFTHKPVRIIPDLSDQLISEIPGIALNAARRLARVLRDDFKRDGEIAGGLDEFAMHVDQVRLWVNECCETNVLSLVGQPHRVPRTDLYKSYRAWANDNGNGILKAHEFYDRLESAGFHPTKISGIRYFEGIRVVVFATVGANYDKSMPDQGDTLVDKWSTTG